VISLKRRDRGELVTNNKLLVQLVTGILKTILKYFSSYFILCFIYLQKTIYTNISITIRINNVHNITIIILDLVMFDIHATNPLNVVLNICKNCD